MLVSAGQAHGFVPVRDSKDKTGPVLMVSPEGWAWRAEFAKRHR